MNSWVQGVIPDELRRNSESDTNGMQLYRYIPFFYNSVRVFGRESPPLRNCRYE